MMYVEPYINDALKVDGPNKKYSELSDSRKKFALSFWYEKGLRVGTEKFYKEFKDLKPVEKEKDYVEEVEEDIFRTIQNLK